MAVSRFLSLRQSDLPDHHHSHGYPHVHGQDQGSSDDDMPAGHDQHQGHEREGHSHGAHHDHYHHNESHHFLHDHCSDHAHVVHGADDTPVTRKALLGVGISGGLLPCPGALILLLTAISLGRVGFGLLLVTVFSLGLAGILITVGLLFIKGTLQSLASCRQCLGSIRHRSLNHHTSRCFNLRVTVGSLGSGERFGREAPESAGSRQTQNVSLLLHVKTRQLTLTFINLTG
jgi:hypothetical protein